MCDTLRHILYYHSLFNYEKSAAFLLLSIVTTLRFFKGIDSEIRVMLPLWVMLQTDFHYKPVSTWRKAFVVLSFKQTANKEYQST